MARKKRIVQRKRRADGNQPPVQAVPLSTVEPAKTSYLIEPYLPLGSIALLEGDPGAGKSSVAAALGAALTRGRTLDLVTGSESLLHAPRSVLYVTTEDSQEQLRSRFEAHDADLNLVLSVTQTLTLRDPSALAWLFSQHKPGLVVLDPIHALLADTNLNAANSVRTALAPLIQLAAKHQASVLAIRHLAKAGRGRAIYRGIGSVDFSAVARSILRVGEDPARPGNRVLLQVKNSYGPLGDSIEYEIGERLILLGRSELTAHDLDASPRHARGRSALELAEEFVRSQLEQGPKPATTIKQLAASAGITESTLRRAEKSLGVVHLRVNTGEGRGRGAWVWSLSRGENGHLEEQAQEER